MRTLEREVLERHGYRSSRRPDRRTRAELSGSYPGVIHLLLTDVVMPGMSGDELADSSSRSGRR